MNISIALWAERHLRIRLHLLACRKFTQIVRYWYNSGMPIALYANHQILTAQLSQLLAETTDEEAPLALLLHGDTRTLPDSALTQVDGAITALDVRSERLNRLNFDMVGLVIIDLTPEELLSSSGRRLSEIFSRLAEEMLTLCLLGNAVQVTGARLLDGVTAGLNMIPDAVVIVSVEEGDALRALLIKIGESGLRLMVLDRDAAVIYSHAGDRVWAQGEAEGATEGRGVTLIGWHLPVDGKAAARLKLLSPGMQSAWPG